jgi:SAM-dependent methyltransferase
MSKTTTDMIESQRRHTDLVLAAGPRPHTVNPDRLVHWLTTWRLSVAVQKMLKATDDVIKNSRVLILGSAEGYEGTILCDLGFSDVTVSDLSEVAVKVALARDKRLRGCSLDIENCCIPGESFDVLIVQDALHHLPRPVNGFTEMLRIARRAVLFLEPHDSLAGRHVGKTWEQNGDAVNYVFRWTKDLVQNVTCSYLGHDRFLNLSFSFWHHNVHLERLGRMFGGGAFALNSIRFGKTVMGCVAPSGGNQFCGLVIKSDSVAGARRAR